MGEVVTLFHPERWLVEWERLGGRVYLSAFGGGFTPDGEWVDALLEMSPTFLPSETADSPRRREVERLKRQVADPAARLKVIDHMLRTRATRGWSERP